MRNQYTVYLNHAGTSWPKPKSVLDAAASVYSVEPVSWPALFQSAHQAVADFFHVDRGRLLLTPSCTSALSVAIMDHDWRTGDRVLTSNYEHHALERNLAKLSERGIDVLALPCGVDTLLDLDALRRELKSGDVRLVALTAACNVTGQLLPVAETISLAHEAGALVLVDGAQIAGWWDLDLAELGADMFTFAGHKGLQAPWGIGGLYVAPEVSMNCPFATCERPTTQSASCGVMPGYCDTGSVDLAALAGLAASCRWLSQSARASRLRIARDLAQEFADSIRSLPGVTLHGEDPMQRKMPTVAITLDQESPAELAARLRAKGLISSGGFQCAPKAHFALGTDRHGVVRFSYGPLSQREDVELAAELLKSI